MLIRRLLLAAVALTSFEAFASSPITGTWQGPCEVREPKSVKFTYTFSEPDAEGNGTLSKIKIYYDDNACTAYNHTGRASVAYHLGQPNETGIYPLDISHRGDMYFDILHVSEDGLVMSFGDNDARSPEDRPTVLSTTDRVFQRVQE